MTTSILMAKRKRFVNAMLTLAAVLGGLVFVNVMARTWRSRIDLTSASYFSLSPASEQLATGLDQTLYITGYFGKIPNDSRFSQEFLQSLLQRYADASGGHIVYKEIDPFEEGVEFQRKLKTEEGIDKIAWVSLVDDAAQQVPVYFHVQFKYLDSSEVWQPPGRFRLESLEYEFSSIIKRIAYPKKRAAVTTGHGEPTQAGALGGMLSGLYDVEPVDLSAVEVDLSGYDVVIVNGPTRPLSQPALMALDSYVMAGQPLLFLVRGMTFQTDQQQMQMPTDGPPMIIGLPSTSGLDPLLSAWGIELTSGIILDGRASTDGAIVVGQAGLLFREAFPLAAVSAKGDDQPLAGLEIVPMAQSSPVRRTATPPPQVIATPLASTSSTSFHRTGALPITQESKVKKLDADVAGPHVVGYALTGMFPTAFPSTAPPAPDPNATGSEPASPAQHSPAGTRVIVFGSAAIADDATLALVRQHAIFGNLRLGATAVQNMVDWLVQDMGLLAARSKQAPAPIDPPAARTKLLIKVGNIAGPPLVLLIIGLISWRVRERRRRNIVL